MKNIYQRILMALGFMFVVLAVVGTILPIMPTVPFLLAAAACFDRSSPKFHHALVNHVHFGPLIRDFYGGKGIPRRAKYISLAMIGSGCLFSLVIIPTLWIKLILGGIFAAAAVYLLSLKDSDQQDPLVQMSQVVQDEPAYPEEEIL